MKSLLPILLLFALSYSTIQAQGITSHQYRRVAPADMEEYLKRETTYWQKFAENEVKKGNMTFWGVFQRVGGTSQESEPNILIINTFKDIDKGADWASVADLFPDVKMEDIQTWSICTNTDQIFLRGLGNHIQVENPEFNFVRVIYHKVKNAATSLTFEEEKWKPMLQKAMEEGTTNMQGWGNAIIVGPKSDDFDYDVYTYDLFASAHAALSPNFTEDHQMPDGFWDGIEGNANGPRHTNLYRIVAVVTDDN
ncbi:MAG: hypothetical protein HKN76_00165 [Saprospiraceae bacterium]|nr:hypothetical protein [Saprospiraceae bacterium]